MLAFAVQLEVKVRGQWLPVIRFDTAHGFAHCDRFDHTGVVSKHEQLPMSDFNDAFSFAVEHVKANWKMLAREFGEKIP